MPPSWLRLVDSKNVVDALPSSGLTLVELGTEDGKRHAHWPTAVMAVVLDLLLERQPVFYVQCGGYATSCGADVIASASNSSPLLGVHRDEDVVVYTPAIKALGRSLDPGRITVEGKLVYSCYIPTLHNIAQDLQEHDEAFGTSAVILDEIEMIRPYWEVTDKHGDAPLLMPASQADGWRATDLLTFAEARTTPTLLVSDRPYEFTGRAALLDVSFAHAVVTWTAETPIVEVSFKRRASLVEPWPVGIGLRVRTYDPY